MKKQNTQRQNNLHIIKDNKSKIPHMTIEKANSKIKNKNLTIKTDKVNKETSFNDSNNNINIRKLTKINSFSKGVFKKNDNTNNRTMKKGISSTSLKCPSKNINNTTITNNHVLNNSNSTSINKKRPNNQSKDLKKIKKNNVKDNNNISTQKNDDNISKTNISNNIEQKNSISLESKLNSNIGEKSQNVKVFIRFRPSNELENSLLQNNYGWLVPKFISEKQLGIFTKNSYEYNVPNTEIPKNYIFSYDKVFSPNSNQTEIYTNVGKRIVDDIMAGYNGTIFAYGQSGSGKTYTMYGKDIYDENTKGIIPRVVEEIFKRVEKSDNSIDFQFKLSVMEIYKEVMYDLFTHGNNLKIIENKEKGVYIENLSEVYLSSVEEFFNYVDLSQKNRKVAETKLNHNSSRSHCIMILEVIQNYKKEKIIKKGILNLVDLAGSEKVSKTGAVGETLEEAKKINLSLSTLGNVIHALTQGMGHIPFRDSKLTRILKESLGGNYKTYLIVTCSPHSYNLDEIISSLLFAKRVKCIKNKYKINIKYSYDELQNLVDKLNDKLLLANEKIRKLVNGEKININEEENKNNIKGKDTNYYLCNNCDLLSKEKKILENKIQVLMESIQEKDNEISKLKEEIEHLKTNKPNKDNKINSNRHNNLNVIQEVNNSIKGEENKTDELLELYKKIKDKLSKIEEENERIKIIQNEEEEIRKINLKKESFNKIIQEFVRNKDKIKCFEKIDNITSVSIPYVKDKDYKSLFNEFKNNISDIFAESFINNKNSGNVSPKKLLDIITTNLFFEYLHFYFSQQIINQGYLKLILDNNSLHKMNKYLFDIVRDVLTENYDIANENAINANAINYLRASMADSIISKPGNNNNNIINDINQKIIKVVSKNNINIKNSFRVNSLNNIIPENNNPSFGGNMQIGDFKSSLHLHTFGNENNVAFINKLKSQEYENSSNKIQMIRNVLVSIIKETDYIRNDVKELNENLNITIKSIMNYFREKIIKNNSYELDIKNNNLIEIQLKSKYNNESKSSDTNLNNPKIIYQNEDIYNNNKIIKNSINYDENNQTYDYQIENINPNTINKNIHKGKNNVINKTSSSPFINLKVNNSNKNMKNNCVISKLVKQNEGINNAIEKYIGDSGTATRKFDTLAPLPQKLNQAKGDLVDNANYFVLTQ